MHMDNWQYFMILVGVHYQVEIPFPALRFKKLEKQEMESQLRSALPATGNGTSIW